MSAIAGVSYASVSGRVVRYNLRSTAINGREQVRNVGGERLEWTVTFPPMTRTEFDAVWSFIYPLDGGITSFTASLPNPFRPGVYENYSVRLANDVQEYDMRKDGLVEFEIDLVQVK